MGSIAENTPLALRVSMALGKGNEQKSGVTEAFLRNFRVVYPSCYRELLSAHYWSFAERQRRLNKSTETPVFGYDFFFDLPEDYNSLTYVNDTGGAMDGIHGGWQVMGRRIATNFEPVYISYTSNALDVPLEQLPGQFSKALMYTVAAEMCISESGHDKELFSLLMRERAMCKMESVEVNMREHGANRESIKSDDFVAARLVGDGGGPNSSYGVEIKEEPL